jgi:hypothetical protein
MTTKFSRNIASPDTRRQLVDGLLVWAARFTQGRAPSALGRRDPLPGLVTMALSFALICATLAAVVLALTLVALTSLTLAGLVISVPFATTLIAAFR